MRFGMGLAATGLVVVGSAVAAMPAAAQQGAFPDVPANHWAYQAVNDLAKRGYVQGDPDGRYHGQRAMTRYEFAMVIRRMLNTIDDLTAKVGAQPTTPSGAQVTQDDLNKLQSLVTSFRAELDTIKTDVAKEQSQIDQLRKDVADAKDMAARAQATANASYGFAPVDAPDDSRRFLISGFVQARYQSARSSDKTLFPQGVPARTGALSSYNGNYAEGGTADTFFIRRARLRASGRVTDNTRYAIMIDAAGDQDESDNVRVKEANVSYTFGKGDLNQNASIAAGLFKNFFGYALPVSTADMLTPERPLAFNDGPSGLWINQDYDRGININIPFANAFTLRAGVVNGTGLGGNDNNNHVDFVGRLGFQTKNRKFALGASYYDGRFPRGGTNSANLPFTGVNYQEGKKQVYGVDARLTLPAGLFVGGEYVNGKYEQRSFFTSDTTFVQNAFAPGNKVQGYYIQGGLRLFGRTSRPITLATNYDVFKRSDSGVGSGALGGASGSSFEDENWGYGALWDLTKQLRLRFWYIQPKKVAHTANVDAPKKVDMATAEIQVRF